MSMMRERVRGKSSGVLDDQALSHVGGHLAVVHRRIQRADEAALRPVGLSAAQARALRSLARLDRPLQMGELAAILDIVPRSATSVIDELEPMGLVRRSAAKNDGRCVHIELTAKGRRLSVTLRELHGRAVSEVLGPLDAADIAVLDDILRRVAHTPVDD